MPVLNRSDIVLVPFPFTDLKSQKVRPAVILSPKVSPQGDVILAFISSRLPFHSSPVEVILKPEDSSFAMSGLRVASVFRMDKVVTLHYSLILRRLGHIPKQLQMKLEKALTAAIGL